ncbi:MAG: trypsin-like peptidase domain-containing protein [Candidatus Eisenbacteria bacterium]
MIRDPFARGGRSRGAGAAALGVLCWLLVSASCKWAPSSQADQSPPAPPAAARKVPLPAPALPGPLGTFESPFVRIAELVTPSVVNVNTSRRFEHPPVAGRDRIREFFPEDGSIEVPSSASGFVLDEKGYIITNNHVVQDAEEIRVTFDDGREYAAEVVGVDPSTDVAVIRVRGEGPFHAARLGDSDRIQVGDWAIAVGNPFGYLEGSVTVGVVSAKGRSDLDIAGGTPVYQNFIQTDASINFGNSGGPLVNIHGDVIGVNTAVNPTGQGIGFAIPINFAKRVAEELIATGRVVRAYLGVYPQELTPEIIEGKRLRVSEGILVGQVIPNSPAEKGGLSRGDVIHSFDGAPIRGVSDFRMLVAESRVGKRVAIEFTRDGEKRKTDVVLVERPDVVTAGEERAESETWLGIEVVDPMEEPEVVRTLGLVGLPGLLVYSVEPGSPAWQGGIRVGDLIQEIGEREVRNLEDYEAARGEVRSPGKPIVFLVFREGYTQYVAVRP